MASSLGLRFGGLIDLRGLIDSEAPAYSVEKEAEYRRSLKKSRQESEFDENKQTIFVSDDDESLSRMPVEEPDVTEFDEAIEFDDEEAWHSVPRSHCRGRFAEYRRLARERLASQQEQLRAVRQKAASKTLKLKSRFNEFRQQWDTERQALEESVKDAERETQDAKAKAEIAVNKLEEMYDRMRRTQELSNAAGDQLQGHVGQLEVDKARLETRVEELQHEAAVLQHLLKQANKEKEAAESRLVEASKEADGREAVSTQPSALQATPQLLEDSFEEISETEQSEDVDIPFPDDISDNPYSGPGLHLADHPIVGEFMRTYQHIMRAKTRLSTLLSEHESYKDVTSNLASLDEQNLDRDSKITPQIEDLGKNLTFVSDQIFLLVENVVLQIEQQQQQQRDQQQQKQQQLKQQQQIDVLKAKHQDLLEKMAGLQAKYDDIARQLSEKEQQLRADAASRDAQIRDLQDSVQSLTKEVERLRAEQQYELQNSLMFTKLDAERNAKSLKKALSSRRIQRASYQSTVEAMEAYGDVSARRLTSLTRHLLHQRRLRMLGSAFAEEFGDSPEFERRLRQFDDAFRRRHETATDALREQRLRLAAELVDTFESVSKTASIFLVRPVLSLQHRDNLRQHLRTVTERNAARLVARQEEQRVVEAEADDRLPALAGHTVVRQDTQELWSIGASTDMRSLPPGIDRSLLNTPRLLEMDVNKILLGQNRISANLDASGEGVRYYVPLKRRSMENFPIHFEQAPPTTPAQAAAAAAGQGRATPALPPIKAKTQA